MSDWPKTPDEMRAAGYKGTNWGKCRDCGARIYWAFTPIKEKMPTEEVYEEGVRKFRSHFTSCPAAEQRRR